MSSTEKRLENIRVTLGLIEAGPLRYTKLMAGLMTVTGSNYRSESVIKLMLKLGYLEKPERGVYRITERGIKMLDGLRNSQNRGGMKK